MSTNQKLELSREVRQWIGTGLSIGSVIFVGWMYCKGYINGKLSK